MGDKISVLIIVGQLGIGGTELHLLRVMSNLDNKRFRLSLYSLRRGGQLEQKFEELGIEVLVPRHRGSRVIGIFKTMFHLIRTLWEKKPKIVHYFLPEAYLIGGVCSYFAPRCIRLMSRRSLNYYQSGRPFVRLLERFLHSDMRAVLGNSKAVLRDLR